VRKSKLGKIKKKLSKFDIDVFLAHEDIEGGEDWKIELVSEIKNSEIIIALLSKNYHHANFTDQELGMSLAYEKKIIPISIDGTIPYGFIEQYQSTKCDPEITDKDIRKLLSLIMNFSSTGKDFLNLLITKLSNAESYEDATFWGRKLLSYSKFTHEQINDIAQAYIKNNQIHGSFMAAPNVLYILKNNQKRIKPEFKKHIKF
jgi:hypothetical protein